MTTKGLVVAILVTFYFTGTFFLIIPTKSSLETDGYPSYFDADDNSPRWRTGLMDVLAANSASGATEPPMNKSVILYDSGWIDFTDKRGKQVTLTHNLNIADWNDPDILVDITGKTDPNGTVIQRMGSVVPWNKTYGGTGWDVAFSVVQTDDGGFALAGGTPMLASGSGVQFWLVRVDSKGNMLWNKTYGAGGGARALVKTSDGGYTLAGTTSVVAGTVRTLLVHTDSDGNMLWNMTYGETNDDYAGALVETRDGGYAFTGSTGGDFWLVRTDTNGNQLWSKTYGQTSKAHAALVQTNDDGFALAGTTDSFGAGLDDFWLVRTDSSGSLLWNRTYGGPMYEQASALIQTGDEGFAIAGTRDYFGVNASDFWLVRTDANGDMLWNRTYGGIGENTATALVQTSDGGFAVAGDINTLEPNLIDFWLVRTDSNGDMLWNNSYGGKGSEVAFALAQTSDMGFALVGCTDSFGAGSYDFWLVRTDSEGKVLTLLEVGLVWVGVTANTITLYRTLDDAYWNYVRVRLLGTYIDVSVNSSVFPSVVGQGQNVWISISTDPPQAGGTSTIQYSTDQIQWQNITSFSGGSNIAQVWTPNVTGRIYVRVFWSNLWPGGLYTSNTTVAFSVDITPPLLTIWSPSIDYTVRSSSPEATWSGSDDIAGIDHYEAQIDQGSWINLGLNTSYTFRDLPDGNHTLSVKAVDRVGLTKEESTSFIINTSLIGGPGWSDDIVVFGLAATAAVVIGVGAYLSKKKTKIPPPS